MFRVDGSAPARSVKSDLLARVLANLCGCSASRLPSRGASHRRGPFSGAQTGFAQQVRPIKGPQPVHPRLSSHGNAVGVNLPRRGLIAETSTSSPAASTARF